MFRAGDTVKHGPSGETWVLACDQDGAHVFPAGWPESRAQAADCALIESASDAERYEMLNQAAGVGSLRARLALRQLREEPARAD